MEQNVIWSVFTVKIRSFKNKLQTPKMRRRLANLKFRNEKTTCKMTHIVSR